MGGEQQMVGIFWLVEDRLIIDASPLSAAEPYGECLTHRNRLLDKAAVQRSPSSGHRIRGSATWPRNLQHC
jgi:hypothetical protein